jgi:hypothetical protein
LDCNNDGVNDARDALPDPFPPPVGGLLVPDYDEAIATTFDRYDPAAPPDPTALPPGYNGLAIPETNLDEDGYAAANPDRDGDTVPDAPGQGCVWYGVLGNDPDRGVASLDICPGNTQAVDIAAVYGLGQRFSMDAMGFPLDPWGNPYRWGSGDAATTTTEAGDTGRGRWYWTFYSLGPDGTDRTDDDITPNERIIGYYYPTINNWENLCN